MTELLAKAGIRSGVRTDVALSRRVLTTVPPDLRPLRDAPAATWPGVDLVDRRRTGAPRLLRLLLRGAREYGALLLNGSSRTDELAAAVVAARRPDTVVVISDATWQLGTWSLDRIASRTAVRAIDRGNVTYCVLSTAELELFPRTWDVDPARVIFTPFCHTLTDEELSLPVSSEGHVFAGGDSMRDYRPLLEVARALSLPLTLAVTHLPDSVRGRVPSTVRAGPLPQDAFVDAMRRAAIVVVPLRAGIERSAGQQTYLNAMALGKLVVATDSPGVRDYIDDGSTGLVVPAADPQALATAVSWALDPANADRVATIGSRARDVARTRYTAGEHVQHLLHAVQAALARPPARERTRTA